MISRFRNQNRPKLKRSRNPKSIRLITLVCNGTDTSLVSLLIASPVAKGKKYLLVLTFNNKRFNQGRSKLSHRRTYIGIILGSNPGWFSFNRRSVEREKERIVVVRRLRCGLLFMSIPMWPDWATFEKSNLKFKINPKFLQLFVLFYT